MIRIMTLMLLKALELSIDGKRQVGSPDVPPGRRDAEQVRAAGV